MAQKTRYNHEEALEMISKGIPLAQIAKQLGVTYQSIYDLRKTKKIDKSNGKRIILISPSFDQIEDFLITTIAQAKEARKLKNELEATRNELIITSEENKKLKSKQQERENRQREWTLAQQQGEVGGNNDKL